MIWNLPGFSMFALFSVLVSIEILGGSFPAYKGFPIPPPSLSVLQFLSSGLSLSLNSASVFFPSLYFLFLVDPISMRFWNMCFYSWFSRHHGRQLLMLFWTPRELVVCHVPPYFFEFVLISRVFLFVMSCSLLLFVLVSIFRISSLTLSSSS